MVRRPDSNHKITQWKITNKKFYPWYMPPFVPPTIFCPHFTLAIWYDSLNKFESFFRLGSVTRNLTWTKSHKNLFLLLTVRTVHLDNLPIKIIKLSDDELVKSEQSTLHLCNLCALRMHRVMRRGRGKKFFWVLLFTLFTSYFLSIIS